MVKDLVQNPVKNWSGRVSQSYARISSNVDHIPLSASEISGSRKFCYTNPLPTVCDAIW